MNMTIKEPLSVDDEEIPYKYEMEEESSSEESSEESLKKNHDDDEVMCILLSGTSIFQQVFGRGRRPNYYSCNFDFDFDPSGIQPPDALHDLDVILWNRFRGKLQAVQGRAMCDTNIVLKEMAVMALWFIGFILLFCSNHQEEQFWWWLYNMLAWTVLVVTILYPATNRKDYDQMLREGYQKVVSKLAHKFEQEGYQISYVLEYDYKMFACSYVRVVRTRTRTSTTRTSTTRTRTGTRTRTTRTNNMDYSSSFDRLEVDEEQDYGIFNPQDWKPLQGKWEMTDQKDRFPKMRYWTLHFRYENKNNNDDDADESPSSQPKLISTEIMGGRLFYLFPIHLHQTGHMEGNVHFLSPAIDIQKSAMMIPVQIKPIVRPISGRNTGFGMNEEACYYYRWDDLGVAKVEGNKLSRFIFEDEDEVPTDEELHIMLADNHGDDDDDDDDKHTLQLKDQAQSWIEYRRILDNDTDNMVPGIL